MYALTWNARVEMSGREFCWAYPVCTDPRLPKKIRTKHPDAHSRLSHHRPVDRAGCLRFLKKFSQDFSPRGPSTTCTARTRNSATKKRRKCVDHPGLQTSPFPAA